MQRPYDDTEPRDKDQAVTKGWRNQERRPPGPEGKEGRISETGRLALSKKLKNGLDRRKQEGERGQPILLSAEGV